MSRSTVGRAAAEPAPPVAPAPRSPSPPGMHWWVAAIACLVGALHVAAGWLAEGPVVHGDEGAYLTIARYLAGDAAVPGVKYFPGYSLLIVPLDVLLDGPRTVFLATKGLNAVLGALLVPALYVLAGRLVPGTRPSLRLAAAGVTALYPSFLLFSNHAFAENALVPGVVATTIGLGVVLERRSPPWAFLGLGALTGYLVVVHPRGAGVVLAVGAVAALWLVPSRQWARLVAFAMGAVATVAVGYLLVRLVRTGAEPGAGTYGLDQVFERRSSLKGVKDVVVGAVGQVLYLAAATWGVAVVGAIPIVGAIRRVARGERTLPDALLVAVGVQFVLVLAISAAFIAPVSEAGRPDTAIYGRYIEAVLAPILLVGVLTVVDAARRRRLAPVAVVVVAAAVGAVVLEVAQYGTLFSQPSQNPFNTLSVYPAIARLRRIEPAALAAMAVVGTAGLVAVGRWRWRLVPVALAVPFLAVTFRMGHYQLPRDHYEVRVEERVVAEHVARMEDVPGVDVECVGLDRVQTPVYHFENYQFWVDTARFDWFSSDWSEPPCGPVVVSGRPDLDQSYPGARFAVREQWIESYLWVLPGPVQDRLAGAGLVAPEGAPVPPARPRA